MSKLNKLFGNKFSHALAIVISALMLFAGCSWMKPNLQSPKLLPEVNFASVSKTCTTPDEVFDVPPSQINPAPYRLATFKNCLGRAHMFVVLWPGENNEINEQFARLMGLHFKESYSFDNKVAVTHTEWGPFASDDNRTWMLVYELKHR